MAELRTADPQGLEARLTLKRPGQSISFQASLPASGVTALFGASGAGKTSCLRMIAGLEKAAVGRLTFGGAVWQDSQRHQFMPPHRRRIGYVSQEPGLFEHLDVAANLAFAFRRAGRPDRVGRETLIDQYRLTPLLRRRIDGLSGGERQRVAIVRALLSDPALLLFDEPLSGLDAGARDDLLERLDAMGRQAATPMIFVSHAIDEVVRLADHLLLLTNGAVSAEGPVTEILTRLDLPAALSDAAGAVIEGVVLSHDEADQLTELGFSGGTLLLPLSSAKVGNRLRCRIAARDVVVTREPLVGGSALNQLPCRITAIASAGQSSSCLVQLDAGGTPILARLTRRSVRTLELGVGQSVWAQVKAVALGA